MDKSSFSDAIELVPYWRVLTTAGRAAEGLRAAWRDQLRFVQREIGYSYIRFHGVFHDEMMVYREHDGEPVYCWTYLDDLFDFLLSVQLRPFLELGFAPEAMKSGDETTFFWRGNISPPAGMERWNALVRALLEHLISRYGREEVRSWYFEVWNEPNLGGIFWTGGRERYFELYEQTARTVRSVDQHFRVGGPATSNFTEEGEAPWFKEFAEYCQRRNVPVDFFSCHPYPNTWSIDTEGNQLTGYRGPDATQRDLSWLARFRDRSFAPNAEIHLTEWNSSPSPRDLVHDTAFMGPFLVESYLSASGLVDSLGYWVFTDLFEENGLGRGPFHGGFGLLTVQGVPKPAFYAMKFLAQLGSRELDRGPGWIVTESAGELRVLLWNYCHYTEAFASGDRSELRRSDRYGAFESGDPREISIDLTRWGNAPRTFEVQSVDRAHGSAYDRWVEIGAPEHLSRAEEQALRAAAVPDVGVHTFEATLRQRVAPHGICFLQELIQP
jgi:xylan 1,4-beta-xylosidase